MHIVLRAIITGFGYKIGVELGRYVMNRVGLRDDDDKRKDSDDDTQIPQVVKDAVGDDDPDLPDAEMA